jgi:N-acetylmuramoyl-L-alanine amidase
MFLEYFRLRAQPFSVTPDPAFLYPSQTHCQALDSLTEGILDDRGFLALIAEPGMGKTTLLHQVLDRLQDKARVAFVFQTQCNSHEFFQYVLSDLGVNTTGMGLVAMHNTLNDILFTEMLGGKRFLLIVDEAQNLDDKLLETVRLLSNFETSHNKLLQIVLAGQPQLEQKLRQPHLAQLLQRITVLEHLQALTPQETVGYINHRLKVAGHCGPALLEPEALALIAVLSHGVPRNINKLCYRALLEAYAQKRHTVTPEIVEKADLRWSVVSPAHRDPMTTPFPIAVSLKTTAIPAKLRFRYKPIGRSAVSDQSFLTGALATVLLLSGLLIPPERLPGMMRRVNNPVTATKNLVESDGGGHGQQMSGRQDIAKGMKTAAQRSPEAGLPSITARPVGNATNDTRAVVPHGQATADAFNSGLGTETTWQNGHPTPSHASASGQSFLSLARELGLKINRIAIDPGHGGFDTGTKGPRGLLEKDLCLDVSLRLGELIKQNIPGAQVVYTRKDDRHVPLEERTAIANGAAADLFISIHANSSESREVRGAETYYMSLAAPEESLQLVARENALAQSFLSDLPELIKKITRNQKLAESKELAADIQNALSQRLQRVSQGETNRGVKRAPFIVLTGANMPAVLSEISFVSNASDENLLLQSGQRQRVAEGLYLGIVTYLDSLHSLPQPTEKLFSENRSGVSSGFATSTAPMGRNRP